MNMDSQWSKQKLALHVGVACCQSQHQCHFCRMSSLFQMSLAAANHICVIHEAKNGCKNLKVH